MDPSRAREAPSGALPLGIGLACAVLTTWHASADVAGLDSGEIGGAAYMLGVAHPTGFPCDMLLLRATSFLPFGTLGFRQNLAVGLVAAGALACLAWVIERIWSRPSALAGATGALFGACALLAASSFISAAVSVEVYASALFCLCLGGVFTLRGERRVWPLLGFASGTHVLAPLLLLPLCAARWRARPGLRPTLQAALLAGIGVGVVAYLPLASRRDLPFDWGDPETLHALWRHLSAARIREAYASEWLRVGVAPAGSWLARAFEQPLWWVPAAVGCYALWRRLRGGALVFGAVFSLDVAYASWINPMGAAAAQLAHASSAVLALAAGCGAAWMIERLRGRTAQAAAFGLVTAALLQVGAAAWPAAADSHVYAERYGALGPLADLPPRAVYVCATDHACAIASFAVYAEGERPDIAVLPAQQLWDRTLMRRLRGLPLAPPPPEPPPSERAALAEQGLNALARSQQLRPLFCERWPEGWLGLTLTAAPALGLAGHNASPGSADLARIDALVQARFGAAGPGTTLARALWSSAYAELGEAFVRESAFTRALPPLRRALVLSPGRAALHTNLGVALEGTGDLSGAIEATQRAIELEPRRVTAWVNLTRLMLKARGREAARFVLAETRRRKLQDERLTALAQAIEQPQGTTAK